MGPGDQIRRGGRIYRAPRVYRTLRRMAWVGFRMCRRSRAGGRQVWHESKGMTRWRRAARCLPCWGLGVKAGWPWG
jgi:hypothetical protein